MSITIGINAGPDAASSSVTATGSIQHVITDSERTAFNIQDAALKSAVNTYFGQAPDDAFVCSPTPWNDLYNTYGWPQVQTYLTVQSATIVGVASVPTNLATQSFQNTSNQTATVNCGITQDVAVSTESNWSDTTSVEIGQSISYGLSFLGSGAEGETSMSFSETWEQGGSESETVTLGMSSGVTVDLGPGESVNAELTASKGTLTVQVVYQLTLSGDTAINYSDTYNGHHFWGLPINSVMSAAGYPTTITTTETITIAFYANSRIVVSNPTGAVVAGMVGDAKPAMHARLSRISAPRSTPL